MWNFEDIGPVRQMMMRLEAMQCCMLVPLFLCAMRGRGFLLAAYDHFHLDVHAARGMAVPEYHVSINRGRGSTGIATVAASLANWLQHGAFRTIAQQAGDSLLSRALPDLQGCKWRRIIPYHPDDMGAVKN